MKKRKMAKQLEKLALQEEREQFQQINTFLRELIELRAENKKLRALVPPKLLYRETPIQLELKL